MKFIFIILIASIFYAQSHSHLSVHYSREKNTLDVFVYSPLKDSISVRVYNDFDNMIDEVSGDKENIHYEKSFDFSYRRSGIYTVIVDIGNKLSLKKNINVKK